MHSILSQALTRNHFFSLSKKKNYRRCDLNTKQQKKHEQAYIQSYENNNIHPIAANYSVNADPVICSMGTNTYNLPVLS